MTVEIEGRVIRALNMNLKSFQKDFASLPNEIKSEAKGSIKDLLFQKIDEIPAKRKFHQLTNSKVTSRINPTQKVNAWTFHLTADDRYKASFTFEDSVIYFRTCGLHDVVDKKP